MEVTNELSVIVEFAQKAPAYGFEIVAISDSFPDAIIKRNGIEYRVEFEYRAKNFLSHRHDPRLCDLIICWKNDLGDNHLPILALSEKEWHTKEVTLLDTASKEVLYWKSRALVAEAEVKKLVGSDSEESVRPIKPTRLVTREIILSLLNQGLTQAQVAKKLKVSVSTLKRTLNGKAAEVSQ